MKLLLSKLFLMKRSIKFFWQRLVRGFDDSETWSMDGAFARLILPRLKKFQELKIGHPPDLTMEEWDDILNQMINGFEFYASEDRYMADNLEYDKAQAGIDLFAKWYCHLWW